MLFISNFIASLFIGFFWVVETIAWAGQKQQTNNFYFRPKDCNHLTLKPASSAMKLFIWIFTWILEHY